jgi:hypothetical protein
VAVGTDGTKVPVGVTAGSVAGPVTAGVGLADGTVVVAPAVGIIADGAAVVAASVGVAPEDTGVVVAAGDGVVASPARSHAITAIAVAASTSSIRIRH